MCSLALYDHDYISHSLSGTDETENSISCVLSGNDKILLVTHDVLEIHLVEKEKLNVTPKERNRI